MQEEKEEEKKRKKRQNNLVFRVQHSSTSREKTRRCQVGERKKKNHLDSHER